MRAKSLLFLSKISLVSAQNLRYNEKQVPIHVKTLFIFIIRVNIHIFFSKFYIFIILSPGLTVKNYYLSIQYDICYTY